MLAPQDTNEELDAGPQKGGRGAERLCAVSRTVKPVDELIRFVVGPQGVVPDLKRKLPGRGLWISADRHTLKDAVTRTCSPAASSASFAFRGPGGGNRAAAAARSARCARHRRQGGAGGRGLRQGRGGDRAGGHRRADPCVGCRRRRGRQAGRRAAPAGGRRPGQADQGFHDGPIGFGIGPVKCGTCSPACRACK